MELLLNLAWLFCSLGLVWFWVRNSARGSGLRRVPRRTQMLALAMIVLLLLPVISLSDDLLAMQGTAETDTCLRRALHADAWHSAPAPWEFLHAEQHIATLLAGVSLPFTPEDDQPAVATLLEIPSLDSRPPPALA